MCTNIWIHVCKWITCVQCLKKANEGVRSPGTVVSQLLAIPWDLGMEPRSSESALNHQVVSPVQAPQRSWALSPLLSLSLQFGAFAIFILVRLTARPSACNHMQSQILELEIVNTVALLPQVLVWLQLTTALPPVITLLFWLPCWATFLSMFQKNELLKPAPLFYISDF